MSFMDIAASLASNCLTLFVGTGFSKYLTDGEAPSWTELLVECSRKIDSNDKIFSELFIEDEDGTIKSKLELTICAQILELEYNKRSKDIREAVCEIINEKINDDTINQEKLSELRDFFSEHPSVNIITTNYDNLVSRCVIPELSRIFVEGSVFAMSNMGQNVYHVHGSISNPNSLILTMNDYFNFQHKENFFSRKLYTLLQETTVVIMGYSLGDFDLNRILNDAQNSKGKGIRRSNIYYVSRGEVDDLFKKYYLFTYGINVIEDCDVDEFVSKVSRLFRKAKSLIVEKAPNLRKAISGEITYKDEVVKLRDFLNRILLRAATIGIRNDDQEFHKLLLKLLNKKQDFSSENNAWEQYAHLAEWLVEVGAVVDMKTSVIGQEYLNLVKYSFRHMSRDSYIGFSWAAYQIWESRWNDLKIENQELILEELKDEYFATHTSVNSLLKKFKRHSGSCDIV